MLFKLLVFTINIYNPYLNCTKNCRFYIPNTKKTLNFVVDCHIKRNAENVCVCVCACVNNCIKREQKKYTANATTVLKGYVSFTIV